ncbi:MAG: carbohydrate-binding protein [Phycisphaerae bacterium]
MSSRTPRMLLALTCFVIASPPTTFAENLHFTYVWHLEQPIYWPARQIAGADRYERAWESIQHKNAGAANPADDLTAIFSLADRVAAYQFRPHDCLNAIRWAAEAGVQISFSGGLIENVTSLGNANQLGYGPTWYQSFRTARSWQTAGGVPRMDIVLFPFHHPLLPLVDENTVRKEVQLYKQAYAATWGASPAMSGGLFPPEMAFSERLVPSLAQEGVRWVIVSNEHVSRAVTNFPLVLGSGGVNCDPPNRADQLNTAQTNWLRTSISRGCSPVNAYPFAYTPHYARYLDPATGVESKIVIVPADQALGWQDGYSPIGLGDFNTLNAQNPPARPELVVLAHDGDNAWGGGFSYYMEAVPNFVSSANSAGYVCTTIEQYLTNHPPPTADIVHVEDGAWVNADGDFGSPTFLNWNWPLLSASGQIDIAAGWHIDERNWAIITAAQNRVETAEQIAGGVNVARILNPDANTSAAERAWHYFLAGLNSGFMYYGTPLDHEVKPTVASNAANSNADSVIGSGAADATPPTIWIPQRHPYNPGGLNFGPQYGYQQSQSNGDFWVWTFVYDVSGVQSVTLKYRLDNDGAMADENRIYAGGSGVAAWQDGAMTRRAFPAGNVYNDPSINFFVSPTYIADQYSIQLIGIRDKLVDYYVEAVDNRGFVKRSPIQHVYVGPGSGNPGGSVVTWTPAPAVAGQNVLISYDSAGRPLASATVVKAHVGFNAWATVVSPDLTMTRNATNNRWEVSVAVPITAAQADVAFNNGAGTWDNNNGQDWHVSVTGTQTVWVMDGLRDADALLVAQSGATSLYAGVKGTQLYVAAPDAGEGDDHFIFVAGAPGALRAAPWAKAGQVANWSVFLADENNNAFSGWFDVSAGVTVRSATGANGGWLEGTIDLAAELGQMPSGIWLALAAYPTNDGTALLSSLQVPASINGDGNVDAAEYVLFSIGQAGDLNHDGCVNSADLGILLGAWQVSSGGDLDNDGDTDPADLGVLLANWNAGCP